jgi:phytoene/squalene synthetase
LTNFWQDVRRDWNKGRVYLPLDVMKRHDYSLQFLERDLRAGTASAEFRALLRDLSGRAEALFEQGRPLIDLVGGRLGLDFDLFRRGGMAILRKIRRQNYDVIRARPLLRPRDRFGLLAGAIARHAWCRGGTHRLRTQQQA